MIKKVNILDWPHVYIHLYITYYYSSSRYIATPLVGSEFQVKKKNKTHLMKDLKEKLIALKWSNKDETERPKGVNLIGLSKNRKKRKSWSASRLALVKEFWLAWTPNKSVKWDYQASDYKSVKRRRRVLRGKGLMTHHHFVAGDSTFHLQALIHHECRPSPSRHRRFTAHHLVLPRRHPPTATPRWWWP